MSSGSAKRNRRAAGPQPHQPTWPDLPAWTPFELEPHKVHGGQVWSNGRYTVNKRRAGDRLHSPGRHERRPVGPA